MIEAETLQQNDLQQLKYSSLVGDDDDDDNGEFDLGATATAAGALQMDYFANN